MLHEKYPAMSTILTGDFNLPGIQWQNLSVKTSTSSKATHESFLTILSEHHLSQLVHSPTHEKGNILDLLCISDPNIATSLSTIAPGLSDHYLVSAELPLLLQKSRTQQVNRPKRLYHKTNKRLFQDLMAPTVVALRGPLPVEELWSTFVSGLCNAVELSVPTSLFMRNHHPSLSGSQDRLLSLFKTQANIQCL